MECGKETVERCCGTVRKMRNAVVAKIRTLWSKTYCGMCRPRPSSIYRQTLESR